MSGWAAAALVLCAAAGCKNTSLTVACTQNSDCAAHFRCDSNGQFAGSCVCADNQACPQNTDAGPMVCNPEGLCQAEVGCFSNSDCAGGQYCDTAVGLCVVGPACSSDVDCAIGAVCDTHQGLCVQGCRSNGDCPLGDGGVVVPCVCPGDIECQCPLPDAGAVDPAAYDRSLCPIGACNSATCAGDTSVCPYNDTCVGGGDGGLSTCQLDPRHTVLCQNCALDPGHPGGGCSGNIGGANFCLLDLSQASGTTTFCGVDCSAGQGCPSGYECDDIIILTNAPCASDFDCTPTGALCDATAPDGGSGCPADTVCASEPGGAHCGGFCVKQEGGNQGFCTCVQDSDCPQDICEPTTRTCNISQKPCDPSNPGTCNSVVSCVDFGGARGCWIGRNCAPTHGLHCPLPGQE
ncbi:MAG: hypothetical protein ACYDCL_06900 [Myxococcales bacterium]